MAKVCKLQWNMRAAKAKISMRSNRGFKGLHLPIMAILAFKIQGVALFRQNAS